MAKFKIGDIVARKSYGEDIFFKVIKIIQNESGEDLVILKGVCYRLEVDSPESDLILQKKDAENLENINKELFESILEVPINYTTK